MGQYQLWLQYREIDQQLHTQLESLERDLAQLQEQAQCLAAAHSSSGNLIIQALTQYLRPTSEPNILARNDSLASRPTPPDAVNPIPTKPGSSARNGATTEHTETVSPALFAWSNLPNFDTGKIRGADLQPPASPMPPHSEFDLLPPDMHTFFYTHSRTAPQAKLPWWLRDNTLVPHQQSPGPVEQRPIGPIDQQSIRTNQLVQRWLERWRKRGGDIPGSNEVQR